MFLTTIKGFKLNPVYVRWEAIAYMDENPEGATRPGCFLFFIGGEKLWVAETLAEILEKKEETK